MSMHSKFNHMAFKNNLYGLAYGCPYIERRDNCPFKGIDQLSFKEKVEWIDSMSEEKKKSVYESHLICHYIIGENKSSTTRSVNTK